MTTTRRSSKMLSQLVADGTNESKFCLFLGAGASAASHIPTAGHLVDQWKKQLRSHDPDNHPGLADIDIQEKKFCDFYEKWKADQSGELIKPSDYSVLFEFFRPTTALRQEFIEKTIDGKYPSAGYLYLSMLVEKRLFNVMFTTNFDNLINDALYRFIDARPLVCSFDSELESIRFVSKRPKIIKLHGDYLFNNIRNTSSETRSLTQNMTEKFMQFCKEFGLIVVGYSGCDESVMDIIKFMLKDDDYLKMGLHWCLRKDDEIPELLSSSAGHSDRLHFYDISSFDILMSEMCKDAGLPLPQEVTDPTQSKTITKLTDSVKAQTNSELSEKIIADAMEIVQSLQKTRVNHAIVIKELFLAGKLIQKRRDRVIENGRDTALVDEVVASVNELTEKCDELLAKDISDFELVDISLIKGVSMVSSVKLSESKKEKKTLATKILKLFASCGDKLPEMRASGEPEQLAEFCRFNFNVACACGLLADADRKSVSAMCKDACRHLEAFVDVHEGISYLEKLKKGEEEDLLIFKKYKEFAKFVG
jgi:NAD-dependent SIR2 family protein deacetylase